jgi:hypothetical protein
VLHVIHMPIAMNPLNTRTAATNERICFIVFTSFFGEALRLPSAKMDKTGTGRVNRDCVLPLRVNQSFAIRRAVESAIRVSLTKRQRYCEGDGCAESQVESRG